VTCAVLALAVLAFGATASAMIARSYRNGLRIGLAAAGMAGALCVIGGWGVDGGATIRKATNGHCRWFARLASMGCRGGSFWSSDWSALAFRYTRGAILAARSHTVRSRCMRRLYA
jgi:hypothetical protein